MQARGRLAAFTAGAWPGLPNLLASHHLQGLLRLDAGAAPGNNPQVHCCLGKAMSGPLLPMNPSAAGTRVCLSPICTPRHCCAARYRTIAPAPQLRPATAMAPTVPKSGVLTTRVPLAVCTQLDLAFCSAKPTRPVCHESLTTYVGRLQHLQHPYSCLTCVVPRHALLSCFSRKQRLSGHAARGGARRDGAAGPGHDSGRAARHPAAAVAPHAA
jgi:hypothetical protein